LSVTGTGSVAFSSPLEAESPELDEILLLLEEAEDGVSGCLRLPLPI